MEGIVGIIAIWMSMMTVLVWTPISAVVYLVGAVIGIGIVWMLNGIGVMGVIYTIVYIGGIAILFVFVIMMVDHGREAKKGGRGWGWPLWVALIGWWNWREGGVGEIKEGKIEVWGREVMETLGMVLYTEWVGVMMVGMILLVVMVGLREMISKKTE